MDEDSHICVLKLLTTDACKRYSHNCYYIMPDGMKLVLTDACDCYNCNSNIMKGTAVCEAMHQQEQARLKLQHLVHVYKNDQACGLQFPAQMRQASRQKH